MLRQVVVDDEGVHTVVSEPLPHGAARVGRDVLLGRRIVRRSGDDHGVLHGPLALEHIHDLAHRALLLPDSHIDAEDVRVALVEDRVYGDGGLARLAVADDQLSLSATDRGHGVDGLQSGVHRLADVLPLDDRGRQALDGPVGLLDHGALAVARTAQGVDHAPEELLAHRHLNDAPGGLHLSALPDAHIGPEEHRRDVVLFQVQRHAEHIAGELQELASHCIGEPMDAGHAVADLEDRTHARHIELGLVLLDLPPQDGGHLAGAQRHAGPLLSVAMLAAAPSSGRRPAGAAAGAAGLPVRYHP